MSSSEEPRPRPAAPAGPRSWADLGPRFASAAVLLAVTVFAVQFGGYIFAAVVGAVFAGVHREWERMVTLQPLTPVGMVLIGLVALSALSFPLFGALGVLTVTAVAAIIAAAFGGRVGLEWRISGLAFVCLVLVALLLIRGNSDAGIVAAWYLGSVVWLTDTGAFFTGRQIGGEKLAPDISPSKTWSGALGGLSMGTLAGLVIWLAFTHSPWWIGLGLSAAMSILGQVGDLVESAIKRLFRIKDSGDIIPGHGGLMDRLDSLTFAVIFLFVVGLLRGGPDGIAAGFLFW